jgi:hypothetical protein
MNTPVAMLFLAQARHKGTPLIRSKSPKINLNPYSVLTDIPHEGEAKSQFGAALGSTVGISSAHRIIFAVSPGPFFVLITLVAGYVNKHFDAWALSYGFENVDSPPRLVSKVNLGS